jgi:nucleotide-binding universal stress UspA family protein
MSAPALPPLRLLVPVDGSEDAAAAVDEVIRRGGSTPIHAHLLHVQASMMADELVAHLPQKAVDAWYAREGGDALAGAAARLQAAGVPHTVHRLSGPVVQTIVEQCQALGCDAIVMGTRGRGRLAGAVLGSVAAGVAGQVPVPVTLVKAGPRPDAAG